MQDHVISQPDTLKTARLKIVILYFLCGATDVFVSLLQNLLVLGITFAIESVTLF